MDVVFECAWKCKKLRKLCTALMGSVLEIFSQNLVCGLHSQQKYVSFSLSCDGQPNV